MTAVIPFLSALDAELASVWWTGLMVLVGFFARAAEFHGISIDGSIVTHTRCEAFQGSPSHAVKRVAVIQFQLLFV